MPTVQTSDHTDPRIGYITNDEVVIADKNVEVTVDRNGASFTYQIVAGQPVPPDLVDAYVEQHGSSEQKKHQQRRRDEAEASSAAGEPTHVVGEKPSPKRVKKDDDT